MLRTFALVSPVPRPEDVGIDAYATLLRRDGPYVTPENPFLVQFKSAGTRRVPSEGFIDMGWLRSLRLPFWISSVDLRRGGVQLYSTLPATRHLNAKDIKRVAFLVGGRKPWSREGDTLVAKLVEPVFEFTFDEAGQDGFAERAYDILKPKLDYEQYNLGLAQDLNMLFPPEGGFILNHDPARLNEELTACRPAVQYLLSICTTVPGRLHLGGALLPLVEFFEQNGVPIEGPFVQLLVQTMLRTKPAQ